MEDNLHYDKNGNLTTITGKDGINCYAAAMLKGHLNLYKKCGMIPTRGFGITKMLARASDYTGQKYKKSEIDKAINDLDAFVITMKAALPSTQDE